ncbi:MAG: hypothetical protein KME64_38295 [Scytonematopsis contorta HA4267-MV1]|jgi:hypothetical protein|nr:hypothetical protein [Scytonematopsis contorta HA4267-MV1]
MKDHIKNNSNTNHKRLLTAFALTGILSIGSGLSLIESATASKNSLPASTNKGFLKQDVKVNTLPRLVANAVQRDVARREQIPIGRVRIVQYSQQTWRNGCLGAAKLGELCTQMLVPGWRVVASGGNRNWVYHTNLNGNLLRLANSEPDNNQPGNIPVPINVRNAVLRDAADRLGADVSSRSIVQAERRNWGNSCLELPSQNTVCGEVLVRGWRLVLRVENQILVYHTNNNGSLVRLNERESEITNNKLPRNVRDAVLRVASQQLNQGVSPQNIIQVERRSWRNSCLDLGRPNESCAFVVTRGWKVVVGVPNQTLVYHANDTGSFVRLNERESVIVDNSRLPKDVEVSVLEAASQRLQKRISARNIAQFEKRVWKGGCLELARPNEGCTRNLVPGWRVVVRVDNQTLVFHTDEDGSAIRFNEKESTIGEINLPSRVRDAVLKDAADWSGLRREQLRIVKSEAKTWGNSCEFAFGQVCPTIYDPRKGWIVTVNSGNQLWVYHTLENGSIKLDRSSLLGDAARQIKRDAARRSNNNNELRVIEAKRVDDWRGTCDGVRNCTRPVESGYEATISNGRESWTYRLNEDGSSFNLAGVPTSSVEPVPIAESELPPPLAQNVVFRQISSGGITGRTIVTLLLNDGRLMQYRVGDTDDRNRRVWRITQEQYREFMSSLDSSGFYDSQNLDYPAPAGSADFITHTITSNIGSIRYNDISQNNLPTNLQRFIRTWERLVKS